MKAEYRAKAEGEAKEALRERWGTVYPRGVARWEAGAFALPAFLRGLRPIQRYLSTTNHLERMKKGVKRQARVAEVSVAVLYLVLRNVSERLGGCRLRGFAEVLMGRYHVAQTH